MNQEIVNVQYFKTTQRETGNPQTRYFLTLKLIYEKAERLYFISLINTFYHCYFSQYLNTFKPYFMKIQINTNGYNTPQYREVKTVSFWKDNRYVKTEITPQSITDFLGYKKDTYQIIVTENGNIYATDETPGYCDGEKTATLKSLMAIFN
jgi:hypothetical protein